MSHTRSISNWLNHAQGTPAPAPTLSTSMTSAHHDLDYLNIYCPEGAIRDASVIESRYLALQLVESDIDDFLLSFESMEKAQIWVQGMFKCLSSAWRVSAEALGTLENVWTTEARPSRGGYQHDEVFYVRFAVHMFVSHMWEPTRQLTCLAISGGALQKLLPRIGSLQNLEMHQNPIVSTAAIEALLCRILNQSVMDNLTAAVSMLCISSGFDRRNGIIPDQLLATRSDGLRVGFRHDKSPYLINLVSSIYKSHKIGQRQPRDPYIAFSHLQSKHNIMYRDDEVQMWPKLPPLVREQRCKCVLVDGISENKEFPKRGLYVFDSPPNYEDLVELPSILWRHGLYFLTMQVATDTWDERYFRYLNIPIKIKGEWNSKADSQAFVDWERSLKMELGINQQANRPGDSASAPMVIY